NAEAEATGEEKQKLESIGSEAKEVARFVFFFLVEALWQTTLSTVRDTHANAQQDREEAELTTLLRDFLHFLEISRTEMQSVHTRLHELTRYKQHVVSLFYCLAQAGYRRCLGNAHCRSCADH